MSAPSDQQDRRFSWLHFSAFQFRAKPGGAYERARLALYEDLASLHESLGPWHAVFVTGDLAHSASADEYATVERELDELLWSLAVLVSTDEVDVSAMTSALVQLQLFGDVQDRMQQFV